MNSGISSGLGSENVGSSFSSGSSNSLRAEIFWSFVELILSKVGRVSPMAVDSILPHAEIGPNDYHEDAPLVQFEGRLFSSLQI